MQSSFLVGYSHHEVICLRFWLLWKDKFAKHHIFNQKFKSHSKIVVETTCQPVLEDHDSRWLERKRCFSFATLVTKSFTFVFDCSGKINLPSNRKLRARTSPTFFCFLLLINRSHEPDTPTKFLACYFCRVRVGVNCQLPHWINHHPTRRSILEVPY